MTLTRSNRLPGLVTKQQAVEFPQVQTSYIIKLYPQGPTRTMGSNDTLVDTSFQLISGTGFLI